MRGEGARDVWSKAMRGCVGGGGGMGFGLAVPDVDFDATTAAEEYLGVLISIVVIALVVFKCEVADSAVSPASPDFPACSDQTQ